MFPSSSFIGSMEGNVFCVMQQTRCNLGQNEAEPESSGKDYGAQRPEQRRESSRGISRSPGQSRTKASRAEAKESREGAARECEGMVVSLEPP